MSALAKSTNFPATLATEMFNKVVGHSALAKLSGQKPIPFNGEDVFVFDFASDVSIVGENGAKPAGDATITPVQIRPIKVVYQSRVSDEFMYASEEARLQYLKDFADGFTKRLAAGLDIMAFHGLNPATGSASDLLTGKSFDAVITSTNTISYLANSSTADANLEAAIAKVEDAEMPVNGIAMSPIMRSAIAGQKVSNGREYPDFAFGGAPSNLGGATLDVNATVSAKSSSARAYVGDFQNAFKWGYAKNIPLEVIEYGNPDGGSYDLKQANQVLLRSEAYIGFGILNAGSFAKVSVAG